MHLLADGGGINAEFLPDLRSLARQELAVHTFTRTILRQTRPDHQIIGTQTVDLGRELVAISMAVDPEIGIQRIACGIKTAGENIPTIANDKTFAEGHAVFSAPGDDEAATGRRAHSRIGADLRFGVQAKFVSTGIT